MRTTLTIDDEVYERLRLEAARRKRPFRDVVNETLRKGLGSVPPVGRTYRVPTVDLGHPPKMDIDAGLRLADELEAEEIQRKLSVKK